VGALLTAVWSTIRFGERMTLIRALMLTLLIASVVDLKKVS
jgi:multidrug transporter EmrE-like cation transporter